jgi:hypothetical protein
LVALFSPPTARPAAMAPADHPLVVNLEIWNPSTNIVEQVNLSTKHGAFSGMIPSYWVAGQVNNHAVWQSQRDSYSLDLKVRAQPEETSSDRINTTIPVIAGVRHEVGKLQDDEFFVTLTRVDEAASPGTNTPVQVWWLLPLVVIAGAIAGFVWALKRPGPRMAGLGTGFLGGGVVLGLIFLAQVVWVFQRMSQMIMALDGDVDVDVDVDAVKFASGIETAQLTLLLGGVAFVLGAIFAGLALFKYRYRALWFHRVLVTAGILMLFLFPVGTVLGVLLLVYVGNRRGEFGSAQNENFLAPNSTESSLPHQTN